MKETILKLTKIPLEKNKTPRKIPETPGIYIYWKDNYPIYIGKAINLKKRINSYFAKLLGTKTATLMHEAEFLSYIKVDSELEALLLEAKLIRKFQPKYNVISKDDKHPLYIKITKEVYPRVLTARKIEEGEKNIAFYGPFPASKTVHSVLKMLRRIFPFSDHKISKRPCLYNHMGLCDPCPSVIEQEKNGTVQKELKRRYLINIKHINMVLSEKVKLLLDNLRAEMEKYSREEKFEEAETVKEKINRLNYITQPILSIDKFLENPNLLEDIRQKEENSLKNILSDYFQTKGLKRIECFDVAHLSGTYPTASMVTFVDGEPDKSLYRRFKIKISPGNNDVSSLKEVAERRKAKLSEWGKPDLIIVDGGKAQANTFYEIFNDSGIPVVGLAKRYETLVIPKKDNGKIIYFMVNVLKGSAGNLVQRIRNEAHRFAQSYHHLLVKKSLFDDFQKS